jgi:hypothetical protein
MPTLLQSITSLIDNITVTDRQEDNIKGSLSNLESSLKDKESGLFIDRTFTTGSYDRDTNIRPLDDIDIFAVLKFDDWKDEYGNLPNPQSVLTKFRTYLNGLNDYKDKVKQDRPCVTVKLSDKDFDILPSFAQSGGGYLIPNYDLQSWTHTYPEQLSKDLDEIHKLRNYRLKPLIKAIKYWNREKNNKIIASYHIEEIAISIFRNRDFVNYEEGIRVWFEHAKYYLSQDKFKSTDDFTVASSKISKVSGQLNDANTKYVGGTEGEAIQIWKDVFGREFPTVTIEEAKKVASALVAGVLKVGSNGNLSTTIGQSVTASKGFYGDVLKE